jgi:hypothetical protein
MTLDNYIQDKGRKELEFNRLTGRSMRIGRRLKEKFAGLSREQIAEKLIERHMQLRGKDPGERDKEEFLLHSFTFCAGRTAHFELPANLTPQEAEKLTKFIQILVSKPE